MKVWTPILAALTFTQALSGCTQEVKDTAHPRLAEVSVGMHQSEVRLILGEPIQVSDFPEARHFCDTFQYSTPDGLKYSHVRYDIDVARSIVTNRNYLCALTDADGEVYPI